jgi:hypothetical protein
MARLDINRTNVLTEVSGIFRISCVVGPETLLPSYTRYVAIKVPNSRHSEPMNNQKANFLLSSPVLV